MERQEVFIYGMIKAAEGIAHVNMAKDVFGGTDGGWRTAMGIRLQVAAQVCCKCLSYTLLYITFAAMTHCANSSRRSGTKT